MKIVLAEVRGGKLLGERTFATDVVLVGRDPAVCHYFFAQEQWPMVSRKHADLQLSEGRCLVSDTNSRFGTFVNGQKITTPVEVRVGSTIQLGAGGPILRVVSIEQTPKSAAAPPAELRRMETFRDPHQGAAPPPVASAPPATPPVPAVARTPGMSNASVERPPKTAPAHLELM